MHPKTGGYKMKKIIYTIITAMLFSMGMICISYAGEWKQDDIGWWYQRTDGSYPVNQWEWIDGNKDGIRECYYFNENGYMLSGVKTPDGYWVNENGAWVQEGSIMLRPVLDSNRVFAYESVYQTC